MKSSIFDIHLLVLSSFRLALYSLVVRHRGSCVSCISEYMSDFLLATCSGEAVIRMPCMEDFVLRVSPSIDVLGKSWTYYRKMSK